MLGFDNFLSKKQICNNKRLKNHPNFQEDVPWFTNFRSQIVKAINTPTNERTDR